MLALAQALLTNEALLGLDEPTEDLAPTLATRVAETMRRLAEAGTAVLIAERNHRVARTDAFHVLVLAAGSVAAGL